ncbi:MAG TPA: hypothetical protein VFV52_02910 [Bacilli bacterium]|nr:hypothetical protein [Bacilli bacterium]
MYKFVTVMLAMFLVVTAVAWGNKSGEAEESVQAELPALSPVGDLVQRIAVEAKRKDYRIEDVGVVYKILPDQRLLVSPTSQHKRLAVYDPETHENDWVIEQVKGKKRIGSADANADHVAWVELTPQKDQVDWEIRYEERKTGIERVVSSGRSRLEPRMLAVFDDVLAWNEVVDHDNTYEEQIVMYDLNTRERNVLAVSEDATAMHFEGPRMYGSRILWGEVRHEDRGLAQSTLFVYDRKTERTAPVVTGGFNQSPALFGSYVVYIREDQVLLHDLATGKTFRVSEEQDKARKMVPSVSNLGVGWISEDLHGRFFRFDTGEVEDIGEVANRGTTMGPNAVLWAVKQPLGKQMNQVFHLRLWQ